MTHTLHDNTIAARSIVELSLPLIGLIRAIVSFGSFAVAIGIVFVHVFCAFVGVIRGINQQMAVQH
jgi:hypothetical protein